MPPIWCGCGRGVGMAAAAPSPSWGTSMCCRRRPKKQNKKPPRKEQVLGACRETGTLFAAGGNVKWCCRSGKQHGRCSLVTLKTNHCTWHFGYIPQRIEGKAFPRYLYTCITAAVFTTAKGRNGPGVCGGTHRPECGVCPW